MWSQLYRIHTLNKCDFIRFIRQRNEPQHFMKNIQILYLFALQFFHSVMKKEKQAVNWFCKKYIFCTRTEAIRGYGVFSCKRMISSLLFFFYLPIVLPCKFFQQSMRCTIDLLALRLSLVLGSGAPKSQFFFAFFNSFFFSSSIEEATFFRKKKNLVFCRSFIFFFHSSSHWHFWIFEQQNFVLMAKTRSTRHLSNIIFATKINDIEN